MSIKTVESNQARNNWREILDIVLGQEIDVVITRFDKPVFTLLDYEDYLTIREELALKRAQRRLQRQQQGEALATMMASERILAQEWDTVEEDEAWQNL